MFTFGDTMLTVKTVLALLAILLCTFSRADFAAGGSTSGGGAVGGGSTGGSTSGGGSTPAGWTRELVSRQGTDVITNWYYDSAGNVKNQTITQDWSAPGNLQYIASNSTSQI